MVEGIRTAQEIREFSSEAYHDPQQAKARPTKIMLQQSLKFQIMVKHPHDEEVVLGCSIWALFALDSGRMPIKRESLLNSLAYLKVL